VRARRAPGSNGGRVELVGLTARERATRLDHLALVEDADL
jgi:hypothetical protein